MKLTTYGIGTMSISMFGESYLMVFNKDCRTTLKDFVKTHKKALKNKGVNLSLEGSVLYLNPDVKVITQSGNMEVILVK